MEDECTISEEIVVLSRHVRLAQLRSPMCCRLIPKLRDRLMRSLTEYKVVTGKREIQFCMALEEALNNAMFHGNLEIDSDIREGDRLTYRSLIEERRRSEPYRNRHIYIEIRITPTHGEFVIRDEGRGFDPKELPDPTDPLNMERPSGRGLLLMRTFMDDVAFNECGNQVTLVKRRTVPL